jgi:hypothetical protein
MCGEIRIMLKYKTMEDANIKFYIVISAPVLVFGSENSSLNRSERREIETAEICFPTRVSGYALTDHVRKTICNVLQTYATITSVTFASYECILQEKHKNLRIINRKDKEMLVNVEDGRVVLEV